MDWEELVEMVNTVYGSVVDEEDEPFIICPECGEPIYQDDYNGEGLCPACEFNFEKGE